ncbi:MAG: type II toxin-antitoxin system HipA family toxin [Dermatophilaceae bacterium]
MTILTVWLNDEHIADLEQVRSGELCLRYRPASIDRHGLGSIALSIAVPAEPRHRGDAVTRWVESLLPEGETRTGLEDRFAVRRGDSFELLSAIGADCAGAVSFLTPDTRPVHRLDPARPLDAEGLVRAVAALPQHPLGADEDVRVSLGGLQAKLLLTRLPDGTWARPAHGAPSTHIAKPDPMAFPGLVVDEAFSLALAAAAGFRVTDFELRTDWGERPVLVLTRFDRLVGRDVVTRVHQEDAAAALGVDPTGRGKYQSQDPGSPSLRKIAGLLRRHGRRWITDVTSLAQDLTLRVAIGDTDGHARNYGFLHIGDAVEMAPIYDVAPTSLHVAGRRVGLWVAGQSFLSHVTTEHLIDEVRSWGVPRPAARDLVATCLDRLAAALPDAADRVPQTAERTVITVADRIDRLRRAI